MARVTQLIRWRVKIQNYSHLTSTKQPPITCKNSKTQREQAEHCLCQDSEMVPRPYCIVFMGNEGNRNILGNRKQYAFEVLSHNLEKLVLN